MAQVTIIDVLRRAGADVTVASIESSLQVLIYVYLPAC
jgi:putative intracellular protease/amidase